MACVKFEIQNRLEIMRKTIYASLLLLLAAGCQKEAVSEKIPSRDIVFNVEYPSLTKATAYGFESGDVTGLYMTEYDGLSATKLIVSGNAVNNAKLTYDGSSWESRPKSWWDVGKAYDVYGYYPYSATVASIDEYKFSVSQDQRTEREGTALGGYEASDFLWAKTAKVSYPKTVNLKFAHKMSRIVVNLIKGEDFNSDFPDDIVVKVHGVAIDAIVDLYAGVVIKNPKSETQSVTLRKESEGRYAAIIVPQNINRKQPLVEVLTNNISYLFEGKMNFKSGVQHTINITMKSDPEKAKIDIGGDVTDWN